MHSKIAAMRYNWAEQLTN